MLYFGLLVQADSVQTYPQTKLEEVILIMNINLSVNVLFLNLLTPGIEVKENYTDFRVK